MIWPTRVHGLQGLLDRGSHPEPIEVMPVECTVSAQAAPGRHTPRSTAVSGRTGARRLTCPQSNMSHISRPDPTRASVARPGSVRTRRIPCAVDQGSPYGTMSSAPSVSSPRIRKAGGGSGPLSGATITTCDNWHVAWGLRLIVWRKPSRLGEKIGGPHGRPPVSRQCPFKRQRSAARRVEGGVSAHTEYVVWGKPRPARRPPSGGPACVAFGLRTCRAGLAIPQPRAHRAALPCRIHGPGTA